VDAGTHTASVNFYAGMLDLIHQIVHPSYHAVILQRIGSYPLTPGDLIALEFVIRPGCTLFFAGLSFPVFSHGDAAVAIVKSFPSVMESRKFTFNTVMQDYCVRQMPKFELTFARSGTIREITYYQPM
jgi:hypothetical protein